MLRFACEARWAGLGNDSFYCSKNGYALMSDLNPGPTQVERRDVLGLDANVNEVGLAQQRTRSGKCRRFSQFVGPLRGDAANKLTVSHVRSNLIIEIGSDNQDICAA